jgi:hypothetical protein
LRAQNGSSTLAAHIHKETKNACCQPGFPDGGIFSNQKSNLGKFIRVMEWKMVVYFMAVWSLLCHLVFWRAIWYILWAFDIFFPVLVLHMYHEKSGNPVANLLQFFFFFFKSVLEASFS